VLQASPAIGDHEQRDQSKPDRAQVNRDPAERHRAGKPDHRGDDQTPRAAEHKPKQRTQDLSSIERIHREEIEDEEAAIDESHCPEKMTQVRTGIRPPGLVGGQRQAERDRQEDQIDQRSGRNRPKGRPGTLRWRHIRHAAERPENDRVGLAAGLPAGQGMAKLVQEDDAKERQILRHIPKRRGIQFASEIVLHERDHKPRPVQIHLDSGKAEQAQSPFLSRQHAATLGNRQE
jgi:hypothetical protein